MKTIFTLLLATISTSVFAYDGGKLTISVASQKNVQVYVDGRVYQDNDNNYVLNNIQPGNHTIKIYRTTNNNGGYGKNRNVRNDRRNDLVYSSTVYVRPSYHVDIMINRFGKAMVDERVISNNNGDWDDEDYDNGGYSNGGYNNGGYDNGGYNNGNYNRAMSDQEFSQTLQKIKNQWFGKLNYAKDVVNNNYFNTNQVRQILQVFSSENDKLELAKASYKNLVDPQNFKQLYNLFSYQSQSDLDNYVRNFRY